MNLTNVMNDMTGAIASFARSSPLIGVVVLIFLAFLIYRKPVFFLAMFFLGLLLAGVLYIIMNASTSGVAKKERLIQKGAPPSMSSDLKDYLLKR